MALMPVPVPVPERAVDVDLHHARPPSLQRLDGGIGSTIDPASFSIQERVLLACLQATAIYNAIELVAIIFYTFRRRTGLYFWSMMLSTFGVVLNTSAFIVNDNGLTTHRMIPASMIIGGWIPMTTGQAFVLYSRLHLLYLEPRSLKLVLAMIITNAIVGHVPTAVVIFGSNSSNPEPFLLPYSIYEKVEVTIFFLQELVLSAIYIYKCWGFWSSTRMREATHIRNIIQHLVAVNILIVALDVTILVFEYMGLYVLQTSYKAFVYSVKLKVEISILNRLVDFVRATRRVDLEWVTREIEQEWTETLQRTVGTTGPAKFLTTAMGPAGTQPARNGEGEREKPYGEPVLAAGPETESPFQESLVSDMLELHRGKLEPGTFGPVRTPSQ